MISTTFAAVVLSAVLNTGSIAVPAWEADYRQAMSAAVAQQKPLAVFIGRGTGGYAQLVGGEVPAEAGKLLSKSFVCVYVDTDTTAGQALAGQFDLGQGLVISSKDGSVQALRHTGVIAPTDLTGYLTRYGQQTAAVVTTEKVGEKPATAVLPAGFSSCPNGRCGAVYPASGFAPAAPAPVFTGQTIQGFSSCPNGRCPNAR